ncbi:S41 family peptidase, partial [bacterium]|nr:S41 family peptidase [bacterium]
FDVRNGELLVISPIEGSPAWKLGIRAGDVIAEIEGQSAAGITTNEVINQLRGDRGSKVRISIRRKDEPELLEFEIIRDKITLDSVRGGFLVDSKTGYVRLTEFSSTTHSELVDKLESLSANNMEQLILDLRFNGGGLLKAAEDISSLFLKKGQLIVTTRGRTQTNEMELKCQRDGAYIDLPIIILVNESSASASEIVAGAIQDHDRGLVIGVQTHGKGLVGSQFHTRLGTAVQITTAQYFTPSGRFIQQPFDIPHRTSSEPEIHVSDKTREKYQTDNGRTMYGEGGITPDIIVEEPLLDIEMFRLETTRTFFDFVVSEGTDFGPVTEQFTVSDKMFEKFLSYTQTLSFEVDTKKLRKDQHSLRTSLRREMIAVYVDMDAADKIRVLQLESVKKAIEIFPQINELINKSAFVDPVSEQFSSVD